MKTEPLNLKWRCDCEDVHSCLVIESADLSKPVSEILVEIGMRGACCCKFEKERKGIICFVRLKSSEKQQALMAQEIFEAGIGTMS